MVLESLRTTVTSVRVVGERGGQPELIIELDVSYLQVLRLSRLLAPNQIKNRKRRKRGIPSADRELVIWWNGPAGEKVLLQGEIGFVSNFDAPAVVSLLQPETVSVAVGTSLMLEVLMAGEPE